MKSFVVALCIVACAYATSDQAAQVLRSESVQDPAGNYQYAFETDNGITAQASGNVVAVGKDEVALNVQGSNSYVSPEGQRYSLTFTADENGYHPVGDHLPVAPAPEPIPDYILRSLEYIAAHPYKGE